MDSGAMYRAVALYFLENNVSLSDKASIAIALENIHLSFKLKAQHQLIYLNGVDVSSELRSQQVANIVSEVAAISSVRRKLVGIQQAMGKKKGIVMDGRDIGTVVFPDAEFKLFVTASMEKRVSRRYAELQAMGMDTDREQVQKNLEHRDHVDSTREDSPLRKAEDAVTLDTTALTHEEQLSKAIGLLFEKLQH